MATGACLGTALMAASARVPPPSFPGHDLGDAFQTPAPPGLPEIRPGRRVHRPHAVNNAHSDRPRPAHGPTHTAAWQAPPHPARLRPGRPQLCPRSPPVGEARGHHLHPGSSHAGLTAPPPAHSTRRRTRQRQKVPRDRFCRSLSSWDTLCKTAGSQTVHAAAVSEGWTPVCLGNLSQVPMVRGRGVIHSTWDPGDSHTSSPGASRAPTISLSVHGDVCRRQRWAPCFILPVDA